MANKDATVVALKALQTDLIGDEWVEEVWNQEFADYDPIPNAYQELLSQTNNHLENLRNSQLSLKKWCESGQSRAGDGFWALFVENDISRKGIIAVLSYIFEVGQKKVANAVQSEASIVAAEVYFTLITIPGSGAFKIFHPVLFEKMVNLFKTWERTEAGGDDRQKRPSGRSSQGSKKSTAKKRNTRRTRESHESEDPFAADMEAGSEEEDECERLTLQESIRIQKAMLSALKCFVELLARYSLKGSDHVLMQVSQVLAELSKYEADHWDANFDQDRPTGRMRTASELSFKGLNYLCNGLHGQPKKRLDTIFRFLLPSLLMLTGRNNKSSYQNIPRPVVNTKEVTCAFVLYLLGTDLVDVAVPAGHLVQQMCIQVPDKVDYRSKVSKSVVEIIKLFPLLDYAKTIEWIYKFSRSNKIGRRVFGLDIAVLLLNEPERLVVDVVDFPAQYNAFLSHRFLMEMVLSRCSDIASTVRTRAIAVFSQCADSPEAFVTTAIRDLVTPMPERKGARSRLPPGFIQTNSIGPGGESAESSDIRPLPAFQILGPDGSSGEGVSGRTSTETISIQAEAGASENITPQNSVISGSGLHVPSHMNTVALTPGMEISLGDGKDMSVMLRSRSGDRKVNVRKSSIQALETIICLMGDAYNMEDINIIKERCQDPALSVRKQCMQSLTKLLEHRPSDQVFQKAFLDGVVPLVTDRETSVQEKCIETLEEVIFTNIVLFSKSIEDKHKLAWSLLNRMAGNDEVELRAYLMKIFQHWGRHGKIKVALVNAVLSHIRTENNPGTWMFLAALAQFAPKFNTNCIVDYWNDFAKVAPESDYHTVGRVLNVMGHVAKHIEQHKLVQLASDLKDKLMQFNMPAELTSATIASLNKICKVESPDASLSQEDSREWFGQILKSCDHYLSNVVLNEDPEAVLDEDRIVRHLFTLGEIAQQCPEKTPKRVFMLVQSLIAAPVITSSEWNAQDISGSDLPTQSTQTQGTQVLTQFKGSKMGPKVRAHAFITLGKLCLQHEKIAKKCVPAMAKELEAAEDPCIRNNIAIILCDLCIRYTTLVDRHFSCISAGTKDQFLLIRKQTLIMLTHLLQEDFLKWKGSLFFRFISAIVDDNKEIKEFAEFCLIHILMKRHPNMFFNNLVECVFHFNSYSAHHAYNKFPQTEKEMKAFSLSGTANKKKRFYIYTFMLENMTDMHRFQVSSKLVQEVLAAIVDEAMPLNADSHPVLQDALLVLSSKEIKLASMKTKAVDDVAETEQEMAQVVVNAAKKKLISVVMKKNVIENTVPTVISLKHVLEKQRSPVLKDLMGYMRELMTDYKDEVQDILAADKQLAREIEFDLRRFEEQQHDAALGETPLTPTRSPRPAGQSPRARGTPRGGAAGTPNRPRPAQPDGPPRHVAFPPNIMASPRPGTPSRPVSLATLAVLNSAKKAMQKAKTGEDDSPTTPGPNKFKKVNWSDEKGSDSDSAMEETGPDDITDGSAKQFKTPRNTRVLRAISTPSTNLSMLNNITFQVDNLSMIVPPSPLANPSRMPSLGSDDGEQEVEEKQQPMIHMASPDRPAPRSPQWNIDSPARTRDRKRSSRRNKEN